MPNENKIRYGTSSSETDEEKEARRDGEWTEEDIPITPVEEPEDEIVIPESDFPKVSEERSEELEAEQGKLQFEETSGKLAEYVDTSMVGEEEEGEESGPDVSNPIPEKDVYVEPDVVRADLLPEDGDAPEQEPAPEAPVATTQEDKSVDVAKGLDAQISSLESRMSGVEDSEGGSVPGDPLNQIPEMLEGGGGGFDYDYLFVGATKITPPAKTSNFLKVYLDGVTAAEWVEAMPETQDAYAVVYDVTKNRIYLSGEFGGE